MEGGWGGRAVNDDWLFVTYDGNLIPVLPLLAAACEVGRGASVLLVRAALRDGVETSLELRAQNLLFLIATL